MALSIATARTLPLGEGRHSGPKRERVVTERLALETDGTVPLRDESIMDIDACLPRTAAQVAPALIG